MHIEDLIQKRMWRHLCRIGGPLCLPVITDIHWINLCKKHENEHLRFSIFLCEIGQLRVIIKT